MPAILRVVRAAMAVTIVVALVAQFFRGVDFPTFDAVNFFSYFTVLSNIGAVIALGALALRPPLFRDESFTVFRGAVTLYMAITGIVYNVLLAPTAADVSVNLKWVNLVVHVIGPLVVIVDWFLARSPIKPTVAQAATWLIFPAVWLVYTMIRGPMADWYPYPFLDPDLESVGSIIITCIGIMVAFVALSAVLRWWAGDRVSGSLRSLRRATPA
ncbi:MAG: Pr6Pr family membrane protein [Ilumatobacteraceae bacterium]